MGPSPLKQANPPPLPSWQRLGMRSPDGAAWLGSEVPAGGQPGTARCRVEALRRCGSPPGGGGATPRFWTPTTPPN